MVSIKREKGVLKLVHPGRYIEVHKEPIKAAEVMRRNPRHCITRPDFFEFPYIVVKPESVLLPGSVFLIVPSRTIYDLLKAKGQINQSPISQQNQYPNNHVHQQLKHHSQVNSYDGMSSIPHKNKQYIKGQSVEKLHTSNYLSKTMSPDMVNVCKYDWNERSQVTRYEDTQKKMEQELLDESTFEFRPYEAVQYYHHNRSKDKGTGLHMKDVRLKFVSNEQVSMLKSCLRRPDSIRKSLNLKVSFNIPIEKEEQPRDIH